MKITRSLTAFEGNSLVVGCGSDHHHQFSLTGQKTHSESLHPAHTYYTVDLESDCSPDLVADFLSADTLTYLEQKKFDFICFEVTTGLFSNEDELTDLLEKIKPLLTENGIVFFFKCSRDPLDEYQSALSGSFQHGYTIESGMLKIWSAVVSNTPFTLEEIRKKYAYCDTLLQTHCTAVCITELQANASMTISPNTSPRNFPFWEDGPHLTQHEAAAQLKQARWPTSPH